MDFKLELIVLLVIQIFGSSVFARFEVETPPVRKIFKWLLMDAATIGLYYIVGHWSLLLPGIMLLMGTTFHFIWCKRNGIDPFKATPKRKYYELRKWKWEE
jgi:hypothetical protein